MFMRPRIDGAALVREECRQDLLRRRAALAPVLEAEHRVHSW